MREDTITILETTFAEFARGREEAAAQFYERLFALDPSLRPLFAPVHMRMQQAKLIAALGMVVASLREFHKIVPVLEALAQRHVAYGAETRHYETVGKALIQTLATTFGDRFTPEVHDAWAGAYGLVSGVMIAAASRHELVAAE